MAIAGGLHCEEREHWNCNVDQDESVSGHNLTALHKKASCSWQQLLQLR